MHKEEHVTVDIVERAPYSKNTRIAYDPRISLNTILICITAVLGAWGIVDKIAASATQLANIEAAAATNKQEIARMETQRRFDRQELITELRDIKAEISKIRK